MHLLFSRSLFGWLSRVFLIGATACSLPLAAQEAGPDAGEALQNWPQWRGPLATGVAPQADPPVAWDETKNIRWKLELPGKGHSTPIVWGDRVFVTAGPCRLAKNGNRGTADARGPTTTCRCLNVTNSWSSPSNGTSAKSSGRKLCTQRCRTREDITPRAWLSASPVTDGERLFVCFGSYGLYCLDMDGGLHWKVNLGEMHTKHGHGEGSSPVLHGESLVVNWDHEEQSFLVAFDKTTGRQKWKIDRKEVTSWATPIVVEHDGIPQLIVSGTDRVRGYDLATGKVLWQCGGLSANIVASPVAADGRVFAGSSYEKRAMIAIRLEGAQGDITGTDRVLWTRRDMTPYVPSPLLYKDALYFLRHYQNVLSRVDVATGEDAGGPYRLGPLGDIYASPVAAAGRIYITGRNGVTLVMSDGAEPEALGMNRLDDSISASAALAGKEIFLRGEKFLYCIAEPD